METQEDPSTGGDSESPLLAGQGCCPLSPGPGQAGDVMLLSPQTCTKAGHVSPLESELIASRTFDPQNAKGMKQSNTGSPALQDLDSFNFMEPPPLDWRSDTSSEDDPGAVIDDGSGLLQPDLSDSLVNDADEAQRSPAHGNHAGELMRDITDRHSSSFVEETNWTATGEGLLDGICLGDAPEMGDEDHTQIHSLLAQLVLHTQTSSSGNTHEVSGTSLEDGLTAGNGSNACQSGGLLFSDRNQKDLLQLLECGEVEMPPPALTLPEYVSCGGEVDAVVSVSYSQEEGERFWDHFSQTGGSREGAVYEGAEEHLEEDVVAGHYSPEDAQPYPAYKNVPGPCDPEDLLDGVIFGAKYLGSTQLMTEKNPSTNARMTQAQEAVDRIKAPEGESQPMTEVDLFISTQRIKVLSSDKQEAMMDHPLQTISYIADIGSIVVLMARRKPAGRKATEDDSGAGSPHPRKNCCMICHVFSSEDAQVIAQAIGQAFGVAYQQFLQANGIKASELRPSEYSDYMGTQELYNGDLVHFSRSENIREVCITKAPGEILGLAVVESGWGSILPTAVVANLLHGGPAERCGELSIGDRIMSVNGTSLVGLPIASCHSIIRDLKNQSIVKLSIVHCPPVTMAIIKRPDAKYQLGFSVDDGIICSLMRGGIAERGGIRVGHRIIEINGQSVVATPHDRIIHILTNAVGEIHLKTMPASTYRLLTGQEQPVFL